MRPAPRTVAVKPQSDASFLIIETGQPVPSMRRHGRFPHWIRVAAGLPADRARMVNVEAGEALPDHTNLAGVLVTGSGAMVTDRHDWSERTADWLREPWPQIITPVLGAGAVPSVAAVLMRLPLRALHPLARAHPSSCA